MGSEIKLYVSQDEWNWLIQMQHEARTRSIEIFSYPPTNAYLQLTISDVKMREQYETSDGGDINF